MNERDSLIIEWAQAGDSVNEIVSKLREKEIPTAKKTVAKVLKNKGFTYDKTTHSWRAGATNEKLMETNVDDVIIISDPLEKEVAPLEPNAISLLNVLGISPSQLNVLREIANERLGGHVEPQNINESVGQLRGRTRANKTFYISTEIAEDASMFAERSGIKLSQLVEVALIETMQKYKK
ncbi:hypothetical protein [Kurthia senegalensis]|uniref:hypothetical protein n=1 Tax=Kurthia senegalensis TaxID=1033740 RepID=UPI00028823C3|nr:hypothetical protein [Kurthia senegalensis]